MITVFQAAAYLCDRYSKTFGQKLDEMKLHKLLYFTQRESLIRIGAPMFDAEFRAWRYGPVITAIRDAYQEDRLHELPRQEDIEMYQEVFDYVFQEFASSKSTTLVTLTHGESSWKNARIGYGKYDASDVLMSMDDIRQDAITAAKRRQEKSVLRQLQSYLDQHKPQLSHIYMF